MVEDIDEYQTVPGVIILVLRIVVMGLFLFSLRDTLSVEYDRERLSFFLHFGASSLVWFCYLPLMAGVALQVKISWHL